LAKRRPRALWVNPNVEFFGLDDVMPSNLNDRVRATRPRSPMCATGRCAVTATASAFGG
jgi:hypothetical protein